MRMKDLAPHRDLILQMQQTNSCAQIADYLAQEYGIVADDTVVWRYIKGEGVQKARTAGNKAKKGVG